ncbi:MAG: alanine--tRNA ligase [Mycoplasma sp.]|nr:alanine--tRNA ligase [Mycoplasma sp.]
MSTNEIRKIWLDYFEKNNHLVLESKSLIPQNDKSLLWINSGVATLKKYFSGEELPPSKLLTNSQRSLRTNDIENVGNTSRHHTFFEMLGNFSIGDYFKEKAIEFGFDFLVNELGIDKNKLYITVFEEDKETYNKWISLGIDKSHLFLLGRETNFWDVGKGPCGPDTEIFYDRGIKYGDISTDVIKNDIENDRYIEIWNIVFSQYNNDGNNNYTELKQRNIDTGAGLERIASISQDAPTNFDTDLFLPIIAEIEKWTDKKYDVNNYFIKDEKQQKINKLFKIISDHMRAIAHTINDGGIPSNVSRGYIIRRLIRRAYRSGVQLGIKEEQFLYKLLNVVQETLPVYELDIQRISKIIKQEEIQFSRTLHNGEKYLNDFLNNNKKVDAKICFKLFETYGFPLELTQEILEEKNIFISNEEISLLKKEHADVSRGNSQKGMNAQIASLQNINNKISNFVGYENIEIETKILKLFNETEEVDNIDGTGYVLLEETPFYATSGGQTFDIGKINDANVIDVFKDKHGNHIHVIEGLISKNDIAIAKVDPEARKKQEINHTANHLMYWSLRNVLGPHIKQLGSYNDDNKIRFDFPSDTKPTQEEIEKIENSVKAIIKRGLKREYFELELEEAKKIGATFLEDEEYKFNKVRVVKFDNIIDICGGTHISDTSFIEDFKIVSIEKKGSKVFRAEAITLKENVDQWYKNEISKIKKEIEQAISKNKGIKNDYKIEISKYDYNSDGLKLLISILAQIKNDYKKLLKESKNKSIEINDDIEFEIIKEHKFYILLNSQHDPKKYSIALREKYSDATFLIAKDIGEKLLFTVASKTNNSINIFNLLKEAFNGRGGGNENFSQGTIENSENIKEKIINLLKETEWEN